MKLRVLLKSCASNYSICLMLSNFRVLFSSHFTLKIFAYSVINRGQSRYARMLIITDLGNNKKFCYHVSSCSIYSILSERLFSSGFNSKILVSGYCKMYCKKKWKNASNYHIAKSSINIHNPADLLVVSINV